MLSEVPILSGLAFLAGFVDAVAGGGGLIQVPGLMLFLPQVPLPMILGTNKFASLCGTLAAALRSSPC